MTALKRPPLSGGSGAGFTSELIQVVGGIHCWVYVGPSSSLAVGPASFLASSGHIPAHGIFSISTSNGTQLLFMSRAAPSAHLSSAPGQRNLSASSRARVLDWVKGAIQDHLPVLK